MTGAIPRSLMTDAELRDLEHDTGERDLFIPTAAGVAYAGSHLGVPQPRECTIFVDQLDEAAGESTGSENTPEGRERPEGDAPRATCPRPDLLARRTLCDENDQPAARGLVLAFIASAALWAGALALAADLGAFR